MSLQLLRRDVLLFFIISLLFFVSIHAFDPFLAPYITSLNVEARTMGVIIGATGLASMLLRFPTGILSDRFHNRKRIIQLGLLFTILSWPVVFFHPTPETLFIAKLADGVTSATWVIYNVMFVAFFPPLEAAAAVALLSVTSPVGTFIGISLAGFMARHFGPQSSFLVASTAATLALLLTFFIREQRPRQAREDAAQSAVRSQLMDKSVWYLGGLCAAVMMVPFATRDTLTPLLAEGFGMASGSLATLSGIHLFFYALATALCAPLFYRQFGLARTAIIGGLLQGGVAIAMPYAPSIFVLYGLQALAGIAFGMISTVLNSLIVTHTPVWQQSTRVGLYQSIYSAGIFFGPVLVGYIKFYFAMTQGFLVVGLISILSVVLIHHVIRMVEARREPEPQSVPTL
ncbi:MFS transporter (plasmid) [Klebsiella michiganensis]|uniref:MFS transporter n=1 Tax=Klebsiella michiganensis TaxID=1134687 RepID=UPI0021D92B65|nr:MFS transporter [Klebsiella michiganensis]UYB60210.1 MFS transporter [Klebsiella michiganensis]